MLNRVLPSTLLPDEKKQDTYAKSKIRLCAFLSDPRGRYLLLQYEDNVADGHVGKWTFPHCPLDTGENPRTSIVCYLQSLTGETVRVATLARPSTYWSKMNLYFRASLHAEPEALNLSPQYQRHAWVLPHEFCKYPFSQHRLDGNAVEFMNCSWTEIFPPTP
jgi:hypothetical protein